MSATIKAISGESLENTTLENKLGNEKATFLSRRPSGFIFGISYSKLIWKYVGEIASSKAVVSMGSSQSTCLGSPSAASFPLLPSSRLHAKKISCHSSCLPNQFLVDCLDFGLFHELATADHVLEAVIDMMIYRLYFEPGIYFNVRIVETVYAFTATYVKKLGAFCQADTVVYQGLIQSQTVDVVKTVLGLAE